MATIPTTAADETALRALFENAPVLIEVRFPACGTSPDWHLCEHEGELDAILSGLAPGTELRLSSVWDLTSRLGPLVVRK